MLRNVEFGAIALYGDLVSSGRAELRRTAINAGLIGHLLKSEQYH